MLSHVYVGVTDFDRALAFYGPLMEILGYPLKFADRKKAWAAWNPAVSNRPLFLIGLPYNGERAEAGNGQMIALLATSRQSVDRCYHAALAQGGQSEGAPGLRPRYHTDYYGAYFRDLDGNKLCVCCHEPVDKMAHIPAENIDQVLIRHAEAGDLDDLLEIYNYYVRETAITFDIEPRTAEQREMWLNDFSTKGRYQCFVAVTDDKTIGWASSHRYNERAAYETTVSTSVYLAPHKKGKGLGRLLYATLFDALSTEDIHRVFAGISLPNEASIRLHRSFGFETVGIYREVGRKFDRYWDVATYLKTMTRKSPQI